MIGVELERNKFSTSDMLLDLFAELVDPLIIVDKSHTVLFHSAAFESMVGGPLKPSKFHCKTLIAPSGMGCCWDAMEAYSDDEKSGLWHIRCFDGQLLPVLASWRSVAVGARQFFLVLQFNRIEPSSSAVCSSFFSGLRRSAAHQTEYILRVSQYLRQACDFPTIAWFESKNDDIHLMHANGLKQNEIKALGKALSKSLRDTEDINVAVDNRNEIFHVFSCSSSNKTTIRLAIGHLSAQLDIKAIATIWAAVSVSCCLPKVNFDEADVLGQVFLEILSPAERDVLNKIVKGLTDKEIAKTRNVSHFTVKNQVKNILRKAGVDKRTKLFNKI